MCTGLQLGDPNCLCVEVEVMVGTVIPATIPLAEGWDVPTVRVAVLPSLPPGHCPHTPSIVGPSIPDRVAEKALQPIYSAGLDVPVERNASPGHATSPGLVPPQGTVHAPGPSPGTVSPSSALFGHIETPPSVVMSYTVCEGIATPLNEITDNAQQLASNRAELSYRGEHLDAHTAAPSIGPLGEQTSLVAGEITQGRFGGRVYESRRRFRSAPASNRMENTTGLIR